MAELPNELLLEIACYLPLYTLINLRNVNHRWRSVVYAAIEAGLPHATKRLLQAWIASGSGLPCNTCLKNTLCTPKVSKSDRLPLLSEGERDKYVSIVGRYAYQVSGQLEPGLSDEFLTWLYEWPSQAGLPLLPMATSQCPDEMGSLPEDTDSSPASGILSPASVALSIMNSDSYLDHHRSTYSNAHRPRYYCEEQVIFLIMMDDDVLLPRIRLTEKEESSVNTASTRTSSQNDRKGKTREPPSQPRKTITCSMFPGATNSTVDPQCDWARFLPISTVRGMKSSRKSDADAIDDTWAPDMSEKKSLPFYVLSGSGLGAKLAGSVCTLGKNAALTVVARSWADWLVLLAEQKAKAVRLHTEGQQAKLSKQREAEYAPLPDRAQASSSKPDSVFNHLFSHAPVPPVHSSGRAVSPLVQYDRTSYALGETLLTPGELEAGVLDTLAGERPQVSKSLYRLGLETAIGSVLGIGIVIMETLASWF
ncbi:hypothetical protein BDW22DRAFT_1353579 [Trametopsis cervina]|nr:hypothetical protein BDW22DRAFT_1353579 [Trametopsis cervina]